MKGIKLMLIKVSSVTLVLRQRKDPSVTFTYEATGICSGKLEMSYLSKIEMSGFGQIRNVPFFPMSLPF